MTPAAGSTRPVTVVDGTGRSVTLSVTSIDGDVDRTRPPVVFCHGFPELAHSWRHQLPAVAAAGFTAVAPDMRGYGDSDAPEPREAYRMDRLCDDLVGLLDDLGTERAVFVGHDWGGFVAWAMPVLHPSRCAGVVGVCTPYLPFPTTELLRSLFGDDERMYMLWFQEPGVAEAVLDPRARTLFTKLLRGGVDPVTYLPGGTDGASGTDDTGGTDVGANPFLHLDDLDPVGDVIVDDEDLEHYVTTFERTGFRGGLNWYRNIDANAATFPQLGTTPLDLPTLMLTAEWDPALRPELAAGMPALCSDLEVHLVPRAGHWVQQEAPAEVNRRLTDWLRRRFG